MEVDWKWHNRFRAAVVLSTIPFTFVAVLFGWGYWQDRADNDAVSVFIESHRDTIARMSNDPRVRNFALSHDPEYSGRLLIEIDVDDNSAYFKLEEAVKTSSHLNANPRIIANVRSGEDLGMDLGAIASAGGEGIRGFAEAVFRLFVAAILSAAAFVVTLFLLRPKTFSAFAPNDQSGEQGVQPELPSTVSH